MEDVWDYEFISDDKGNLGCVRIVDCVREEQRSERAGAAHEFGS